jgi:hypothetical protein
MLVCFASGIPPAMAEEQPQLEWENVFGWQGYRERVADVFQTGDGGYLLVVEKSLDVDWRSGTKFTVDACVIKLDAGGQKVWEKVITGDCAGVGDALLTSDGGFIIGLSTKSPVSVNDQLLRNITAVKIDASGNILWESTLGGEKDDYVTSLAEADGGGCLVAGSSNSFNNKGDYNVYLAKINVSGEKLWEKTYGGDDDDAARVIREAGDGGYFIAGSTFDDIYLIKTGVDGSKTWEKIIGGRGPDNLVTAQRTADGGLVMVGTTGSYPGWEEIYLVMVNASGEQSWQRIFGREGDYHDYGISVRETKDGGFLVLGDSSPFGEGRSSLLIKAGAFGDKVWESIFQDKEYVWSSGIELAEDGYIISGGEHDQDSSAVFVAKTDSEGNKLWKKTFGEGILDGSTILLSALDGGCLTAGSKIGLNDAKNGNEYNIYIAKIEPEQPGRETGLQPIKVYLNGNLLSFDVPPITEDGRTLVPFRAVGEALGAEVAWDGQSRVVTLNREQTKIELKIGDPAARVNGEDVNLDVPAKIMNDRTLVPLRFVAEYLGAYVQWDGEKRVITIETNL